MKTFEELSKEDQKLIWELMDAQCKCRILDVNDPILINMSFEAKELAISMLSSSLPPEFR